MRKIVSYSGEKLKSMHADNWLFDIFLLIFLNFSGNEEPAMPTASGVDFESRENNIYNWIVMIGLTEQQRIN